MPFTDEFRNIRKCFRNKYKDEARADTFAFQKAFKEKIPTWKEREKRIKRRRNNEKISLI